VTLDAYYHELTHELRGFGYRIRNLRRGDFQLEGIPDELCERFSKRDAEIDKALSKLLAENLNLLAQTSRNCVPNSPRRSGCESRRI
jgi:hypothetical protein